MRLSEPPIMISPIASMHWYTDALRARFRSSTRRSSCSAEGRRAGWSMALRMCVTRTSKKVVCASDAAAPLFLTGFGRAPRCSFPATASWPASRSGRAAGSSPSGLNHSTDCRLLRRAESSFVLAASVAAAPASASPRARAFACRCCESSGAPATISKVFSTVFAILAPCTPRTSGRVAYKPRSRPRHRPAATKRRSCREQKHSTTHGTTAVSNSCSTPECVAATGGAEPSSTAADGVVAPGGVDFRLSAVSVCLRSRRPRTPSIVARDWSKPLPARLSRLPPA
mmetsp:Transcript_79164/g.224354  ORF Transcript_79164/g.224354 Transcript_79164/m.224354 type:complete len:284 (-) Transcript_79164:38-889(-)